MRVEFGVVPHDVLSALRSPKRLRTEILAGLVVALALIPEAISFSIIAGVDPSVGLFSAFTMAVTIAIVGGRTAMISAATGSVALVIAPIVPQYGLDYLVVTVLLGGVMQIVLTAVGAVKLMRFIPRSVMVGFVNALAILIFIAQIRYFVDVSWLVFPIAAAAIVVMIVLPRLTSVIPAPLVAVAALTLVTVVFGLQVPNVGDEGDLPSSLPSLFTPDVPWNLETLTIVAPFAFAMALVGLLESLLTAKLVDDVTDTPSNKTREGAGLGIANIVTGAFGGMGGCALIGQTMINVKISGARTRISTFLSGAFLLVLVVALGDVVARIPMAVLGAVMIMVCFATFDWHSIRPKTLRRMPLSETAVMVATVAVTVATDNLAYGVIVGVVIAMILFARRVAHVTEVVEIAHPDADTKVYGVRGELFFASSNDLIHQFDYAGDPSSVVIDLSQAHVWDASTVATLDAVTTKYAGYGKEVSIVGLSGPSKERHARLTGQLGGEG